MRLTVFEQACYKCHLLSLMLTDSDLVGLRWVGDATVGCPWIALGETMNDVEAYGMVLKCRTLHPNCLSTNPASVLTSLGKLPKLNFLSCKIGDNDGIYFIGLFEV